jgi:hypothetical protein
MCRKATGACQGDGDPHHYRCPVSHFHALQTTYVACRFPHSQKLFCSAPIPPIGIAAPRAPTRFCLQLATDSGPGVVRVLPTDGRVGLPLIILAGFRVGRHRHSRLGLRRAVPPSCGST